jgi:hypothetical protein
VAERTRAFFERIWSCVKHEGVSLIGYSATGELMIGLTKYLAFYNMSGAGTSHWAIRLASRSAKATFIK